MELSLLTYPEFFNGESKVLNYLLDNYKFTLHIRKPIASELEYEGLTKIISDRHYNRIVLHNAYNLKQKYGIIGIHFNKKKRYLMEKLNFQGFSSTSCHSLEEVKQIDGKFNYAFISPVFKSISKLGYLPVIDHDTIKQFIKQEHTTQLIALGGIDQSTLQKAGQLGFTHVAVLGAVWGESPENTQQVISNFESIYACI